MSRDIDLAKLLDDYTEIVACLMAFISHKNLISEYYEFVPKFMEYIETPSENDEFNIDDFESWYEEQTGGVRDA